MNARCSAGQGARLGQDLYAHDRLLGPALAESLATETVAQTAVVMATEFRRTVRINGANGADPGAAFTALALGGALRNGGLMGDAGGLLSRR